MPIANPFQEPGPDSRPDAGGAPESFGRPERRRDERDRPRTRTRTKTPEAAAAAPTPPHSAEQGAARDQTPGARVDAAEVPSAPHPESGTEGGEVVPFPGGHVDAAGQADDQAGSGELVPVALAGAARGWWAEASATARQALDGSVWRARPPALRDSAARLQRAEWSGGLPALRWAGWIYGYPALAVRAALMGVIWLLDHPTRLIVLAGVIAAALFF